MDNTITTRFEMRISKIDKALLEKASKLKGYSTLAGFIKDVVKGKAEEIIEKEAKILASDKDKEIFFETLLGNQEPSDRLKKAAQRYQQR